LPLQLVISTDAFTDQGNDLSQSLRIYVTNVNNYSGVVVYFHHWDVSLQMCLEPKAEPDGA